MKLWVAYPDDGRGTQWALGHYNIRRVNRGHQHDEYVLSKWTRIMGWAKVNIAQHKCLWLAMAHGLYLRWKDGNP